MLRSLIAGAEPLGKMPTKKVVPIPGNPVAKKAAVKKAAAKADAKKATPKK